MSRRKRPSVRRLKARFARGEPVAQEDVVDRPRLEAYVIKLGYVADMYGGYVVRA